ncbi:hypothetical protein [Helicobacter cetorum]|uniref:hypothetical protein n=1 Tax=Helicobacter cetorum TaxID=138563 RepID=UPI000CF16139|nr:hypothetical protein [Helicobacter cetorum]
MPKIKKYYKRGDDFHSTTTHRKLTGGARNNCEFSEMGGQEAVMKCAKAAPMLIELVVEQDKQISSLKQAIVAMSPTIYEKMQRNFK